MPTKIKISAMNKGFIDFHFLNDLQGDLKILSRSNLAKLKRSILRDGFDYPFFVWIENKGTKREKYFIHDGHQRKRVLSELENDGYEIPKVPYIEIEAADRKDAIRKLLQVNSRYGEYNPESTFLKDNNIDFSALNDIHIPELKTILKRMENPVMDGDGRPEIEFTTELLESHNYLVLTFDNIVDWNNAINIFNLKTVRANQSKPGTNFDLMGIGRVLNGAKFLDMINKEGKRDGKQRLAKKKME